MIVRQEGHRWEIHFESQELARWESFSRVFGPRVNLRKQGWWQTAPNSELWTIFVAEFAVRGGTALFDGVWQDAPKREEFVRRTSLAGSTDELRAGLKSVTRFWQRQADAIEQCRRNTCVVRNCRFVLLGGVERIHGDIERRNEIRARCPALGLKGTSDFLVSVGAVEDIAAIDTRVIACLKRHFGLTLTPGRVQSSLPLYLAVERGLHEAAEYCHISLARLDRAVFQASGTSVLDFLLDPERRYGDF
jgi:thermostable 8-oxoguanine DNA glycosylase